MKKPISNDLFVQRRRAPEFILPIFFALFVGLLLPGLAGAAGGWQWQFNLVSPDLKKPFLMPTSLYIETESKRFYVVDSGNNSLHSFRFDGEYLNSFNPDNALQQPFAMGRDSKNGQLWVVEKGRNSLTRIDLKAKALTPEFLKYRGATVYPDRLSLVNDKLYVLDKPTGIIIEYGFDLQPSGIFEGGNGFIDFVVKESEVWALDGRLKKVFRFDLAGKLKSEISLGDKVSFPVALEVGPSGFLYVIDKHEGTVVVFDTAGNFKYLFLEKGHGDNKLYYPEDILFDPLGRLCVVDTGNGRVGVFSR
jgi:DNA-binding beta-propeller fold protein YncE